MYLCFGAFWKIYSVVKQSCAGNIGKLSPPNPNPNPNVNPSPNPNWGIGAIFLAGSFPETDIETSKINRGKSKATYIFSFSS